MSRKSNKQRQKFTEAEKLKDKHIFKVQTYERPVGESNRYFRIMHYMLMHRNFCNLSSNAVVVYLYMRDWVYDNEEYLHSQIFPFSASMITNKRKMSRPTVVKALKELEHFGFIKRENNACFQSGLTQYWSFIDDWFTGEKSAL